MTVSGLRTASPFVVHIGIMGAMRTLRVVAVAALAAALACRSPAEPRAACQGQKVDTTVVWAGRDTAAVIYTCGPVKVRP